MNHHSPGVGAEQQILGSTTYPIDSIPCHYLRQFRRNGPSQARLANNHSFYRLTDDVGFNTPASCFDFWKLRHRNCLKLTGFVVRRGKRRSQLRASGLLDLGFFVDHMLADNGVKFLDLHFVRHRSLILVSRIEVTRTCGRNQFNLFSHD